MPRHFHVWCALAAAGLSGAACSLIVPGPDDFVYWEDAGADGGMDAATEDAGPPPDDAGFDGGSDAGACGVCTGLRPYCDPMSMACVACMAAEHCDDGDFCTADRCGLDGTCFNDLDPDCVAGITAGGSHTCAWLGSGVAYCWGRNSVGQLGNGATSPSAPPVAVDGLADARHVVAGPNHTCAIRRTGTVACWGSNSGGQLGADPTMVATSTSWREVAGVSDVLALALESEQTCALRSSGEVLCWGMASPTLGRGGAPGDGFTPTPVADLSDAIAIGATCAIRSGGTVACWGYNLGDGTMGTSDRPVTVLDLSGVAQIGVGGSFACARLETGSVLCWGGNDEGQLGDGTLAPSSRPVLVDGLTDAVDLAVGVNHTCASRLGGTVVCWGIGDSGELGDGLSMGSRTPVAVTGLSAPLAVTAGSGHSCAATGPRQTVCWGSNFDGQLGDGTMTNRSTPVPSFSF